MKERAENDENLYPGDAEKKSEERSIMEKMKLPNCMMTRTDICKHKFGCYENTVRGWCRSFLIAFGIKSLILHLPKIVNPINFIKNMYDI